MTQIVLLRPSLEGLPAYEEALARGWSPNTDHDVSQDELLRLRRDPKQFFYDLYENPLFRLPDGTQVPRLPAHDFWISDGEFCGRIGFRFQRDTEDLPSSVSGHIGYTIVPWKQRRGYATQALRMILPIAKAEGFPRVLITCDEDNEGSRKVIIANGGVPAGADPHPTRPGHVRLKFWVPTIEPREVRASIDREWAQRP